MLKKKPVQKPVTKVDKKNPKTQSKKNEPVEEKKTPRREDAPVSKPVLSRPPSALPSDQLISDVPSLTSNPAQSLEKTERSKDFKNIQVFLRIRPLLGDEVNTQPVIVPDNDKILTVNKDSISLQFEFEKIFREKSTQEQVYDVIGKNFVSDIIAGYNGTIFASGQSGSGKTRTMTGYSDIMDNKELLLNKDVSMWKDPRDMGLVPRIVRALFNEIYTLKDSEFSIQVSYLEIYMEKIRDLLNPVNDNLEIRESQYKGLWVEDITSVYVTTFDDLIKVMRKAETNRTVAETLLNSHSSRSHSVLTVRLSRTNIKTGARTRSKMVFVDLAGSEKIEKSGASGIVLKQAQYNNKSLLTLGLVIRELAEKKPFIRYRDSKLTRLLSESLGGNSRTALIATCSPSELHLEETLSTLRFASLTSQIKNIPKINLEATAEEFKKQLLEAMQKIATQQMIIDALEKDIQVLIKLCDSSNQGKKIDITAFKQQYSLSLRKSVNIGGDSNASYDETIDQLQCITKELEVKTSLIGDLQKMMTDMRRDLQKAQDEKQSLQDKLIHEQSKISLLENSKSDTSNLELVQQELKVSHAEAISERDFLKERVEHLTAENDTLRQNAIKNWNSAPEGSTEKDGTVTIQVKYEVLNSKVESEMKLAEDLRRQLEGKNTHVKILEKSIDELRNQVRQLMLDTRKREIEYTKKVKDLEVIMAAHSTTNVMTPIIRENCD